jgi:hypothetical protein
LLVAPFAVVVAAEFSIAASACSRVVAEMALIADVLMHPLSALQVSVSSGHFSVASFSRH